MKKLSHILAVLFVLMTPTVAFNQVTSDSFQASNLLLSQKPVLFQENKGQILDVKGNTVPSVLFKASTKGVDAYITTNGLVYVFSRKSQQQVIASTQTTVTDSESVEMEWLQVHLEGAEIRTENIKKEFPGETDYRFFLGHCPNGITGVKEYEKITISNVYPGIDWVVYGSNERGMKYDFIVHPGANADLIHLIYEGENPVKTDDHGNILAQLDSGTFIEKAPVSFVEDLEIRSAFKSEELDKHHVRMTYVIGDYDGEKTLRIDPELVWGTLFGSSSGGTIIENMTHDKLNNVFVCGETSAFGFPLLDAGTYFQATVSIPFRAPFIAKFNGNGKLLWSTIYGFGYVSDLACDGNNNVFVVGKTHTTMSNGLPFPVHDNGTYFQPYVVSFETNTFILKFDNEGNVEWATIYGGSDEDHVSSVTCDKANHVFIIGSTSSPDFPLQNSGTYFEPYSSAGDPYILKFDNEGNRLWATCYGDTSNFQSLICDTTGNLFVIGSSSSANFPLQDAGTYFDHVTVNGDSFILKFDNSGNRLWGTFYGGSGYEEPSTIIVDADQNIFVSGITFFDKVDSIVDFPLQDAGTYFQSYAGGNSDAFLLKFDNAGNRLWSTCYGGTWDENSHSYFGAQGRNLSIDDCGNIYMGFLTSSDNIRTKDAGNNSYFDGVYTGNAGFASKVFVTEFTNSGSLLWASFIQGPSSVSSVSIEVDQGNQLFLGGLWFGSGGPNSLFLDPGNGAYFDTTLYNPTPSDLEFKYINGYLYKFAPNSIEAQNVAQTVTDCGCIGSATVEVTAGTPPYTFNWSDGTQTVNDLSATNNTLCVGDQSVIIANCNTTDTVFFSIATDCLSDITVPNIIVLSSKEGNNSFFVETKSITDFHCVIVNRWGNLIYESNDGKGSWNGTNNGNPVSEGVYFYHITAATAKGDQINKEGFIHVYH